MQRQHIAAIVPTDNEAASLLQVIRDLWSSPLGLAIVVIDDGSKDEMPALCCSSRSRAPP